ncbi:hypothetical protein, partial [Erwinia amylovora]|uniref:hypothetical protein n=1 Tax=Erwinia amylovora TaxID=552 RepID=UPI0020C070B9
NVSIILPTITKTPTAYHKKQQPRRKTQTDTKRTRKNLPQERKNNKKQIKILDKYHFWNRKKESR